MTEDKIFEIARPFYSKCIVNAAADWEDHYEPVWVFTNKELIAFAQSVVDADRRNEEDDPL